jgi:hypothetical protein
MSESGSCPVVAAALVPRRRHRASRLTFPPFFPERVSRSALWRKRPVALVTGALWRGTMGAP